MTYITVLAIKMYILPQEQEDDESETVLSTVTENFELDPDMNKKANTDPEKNFTSEIKSPTPKGKPQNAQAIAPKTSVKNYLTQK